VKRVGVAPVARVARIVDKKIELVGLLGDQVVEIGTALLGRDVTRKGDDGASTAVLLCRLVELGCSCFDNIRPTRTDEDLV
jgi:hypothetical protein